MKFFIQIFFILFLFLCVIDLYAQESDRDKELVQFSGIVVRADSLIPVPFTNIMIKNSTRGTISDYSGYFSFVAEKNDTVLFSAVGLKKAVFVIPDTITKNRYSLIQAMIIDTILLPVTSIYPWPTKEQFKEAFLNLKIPDDDMERARKNMAREQMKERIKNCNMDGSMNYTNYVNNKIDKLYYAGQIPPNNLLNPFAWAQFFKAWKEGKFKKKE